MSLYPASPSLATAASDAVIVAVRLADLAAAARRPAAARSALVVAGTEKIRSGELVAFCKLVAAAPAVVRRDGRVQARGKPCDHARLGVLEERLDEAAGPDTIGRAAARIKLEGMAKGAATRTMTTAFAVRAVLLMTLMPEAGYGEVMTALAGDLAVVPWARPWQVPSDTVLSAWRDDRAGNAGSPPRPGPRRRPRRAPGP